MTVSSHLDRLDARIARRGLLLHPFYQAWTRGELSLAALQDYARQYYHHVRAFPTYISALHSHTDDLEVRRHLLDNLVEEEGGQPNHPELWLRFAGALGVAPGEAESVERWPETEALVGRYRSFCRDRSEIEGLAALYAYESQIPAVATTKIDGLQRWYGIDSDAGLEYFRVHVEADTAHAADERALLADRLDAAALPAVEATVDEALEALYGILDGVCVRHGIACTKADRPL